MVVGAPHSAEPSLQARDVEGAQSFTVPPPIGFEMGAVSQLPEVREEQLLHGPLQDVEANCASAPPVMELNGLVTVGQVATFAEHSWFEESLHSPDEPEEQPEQVTLAGGVGVVPPQLYWHVW